MRNTICIAGMYFGPFPDYFALWLKSAEYNSTIDFLVITDQKVEVSPSNVRIINMTLPELKQLAEKKLGFQICLKRPYKCCDLKPAYGMILSDFMNGYDYWGHCDFDLIWGDIRQHTENYHLEKYDKFLPWGHLSLYRNTEENNRRFMLDGSKVGDYKAVFQDEHNFAFDELFGVFSIYTKYNFPVFSESVYADISAIHRQFKLTIPSKGSNYNHQAFYWRDGHVYREYVKDGCVERDEFVYIHFKERGKMPIHDINPEDSSFFITDSGFWRNSSQELSLKEIDEMNPWRGRVIEKYEIALHKIKCASMLLNKQLVILFNWKETIR